MKTRALLLAIPLGITLACSETTAPTDSRDSRTAKSPRLQISDGSNGGSSLFYWLPPIGAEASFSNAFDGSLSPAISVYPCTDTSACTTPIAQFTLGSGLSVNNSTESYNAVWEASRETVSAGQQARIVVTSAGQELGYADVQVVRNKPSLTDVSAGVVGVVHGDELSIAFRLEVPPDPSIIAPIPSANLSTVIATPLSIPANGTSTSTIRAHLRDFLGDDLLGGDFSVAFQTTAGTIGTATYAGGGVWTATLTSSSSPATATVTVSAEGVDLLQSAAVQFTSGALPPEPAGYAVTSTASSVAAGSSVTITAQLKDGGGNNLALAGRVVEWSATGGGSLAALLSTTDANGRATVTFATSTTAGATHTVTADDGVVSGTSGNISTVPGAAAKYVVTSSSTNPPVGTSVTITARLTDQFGNTVAASNQVVTWSKTNGGTLGSTTSAVTNGIATVTFAVSSSVVTHVVTATDAAGRVGSVSVATKGTSCCGHRV